MPDRKVVVCACAKCGSTSMLQYVYANTFGHNWSYSGEPYLQEVWSERWESQFKVLNDFASQQHAMHDPDTFSFALIRDPKERVLSAWSSKAACDQEWSLTADTADRAILVPKLLALQGKGQKADCLELHEFLVVLKDIQDANKTAQLNDHFRPQTHQCFTDFTPDHWSKVVEIGAPHSFDELGHVLSGAKQGPPPHSHTSYHGFYSMTKEDEKLLDEITADERGMLSKYLQKHEKEAAASRSKNATPASLAKAADTKEVAASYWAVDGCQSEADVEPKDFAPQQRLATKPEGMGVRCCLDRDSGGATCTSHLPGCMNASTWQEASDACGSLPGGNHRLCTVDELLQDACCKTGCNLDSSLVWTSTVAKGGASEDVADA